MAGPPRRKLPSKPPQRRRRWMRFLVVPLVVILAVGVLAAGVSAFWVLTILPRSLPSVTQLESFEPSVGSKIYDENDEPITEFHVERRIFVALSQMPPALKEAVIATEDARFYSHFGVDPMGIARAIYQNFRRGRIVDTGVMKPSQAKHLAGTGLGLVPPERRRTTGQYYLEYVLQYLEAQFGADLVFKGGLHVYTTLSPLLQLKAESSLRDGLRALQTRRAASAGKDTAPPERPEGALLALEPQTGYTRAMVGGYDFFKSEFNRAVQARRQPGSAFKPFVYMAALESGQTPASVVDDSPIQYPLAGGKIWRPDNYDRKFRGPITYQQALEESINVAAIRVQERPGLRRTVDIARRLGA